jgi:hypothetical protein
MSFSIKFTNSFSISKNAFIDEYRQVLLDNNISLKRYTQCECRPNNFERKLLEMCKSALAIFEKYCHHWKLKVNLQKTKVVAQCSHNPIFQSHK